MALAKSTGAAAKFEDAPAASNTATTATTPAAPAATAPAAAGPTASTQVAPAAPKALPVATGGKFQDFFKEFENKLEPVKFGTLPRLIGVNGGIFVKGNNTPDTPLGDKIELTIVSFHKEYVVTPGGNDNSPEAKALVKYSLDGETLEGTGQPVATYIESLKAQGHKDAKKKQYVHLLGVLESAAKPCSIIGDIVDVTIAPDGVSAWENHRIQRSQKISRGLVQAAGSDRVSIMALSKSRPGQNWVALIVGPSEQPVQAAA